MFSEDCNVRKIQESTLEILKITAQICDKNNLTYYLCGGSLIGAIRHKGFIPWDDDIDIMMPRKDYNKLVQIARQELPSRYKLAHYKEKMENGKPLMRHVQILDQEVHLLRNWSEKSSQINAWIDIFPLDGMPNGKLRRKFHYLHFLLWHILMQISWFEEMVNLSKPNRSKKEKLLIEFVKRTHVGHSWDTVKIIDRIEKICGKYPFEKSDMIASLYGAYQEKEILPRKWFEKRILVPFEDTEFYIPSEYDAELRHYYGDYMEMPKTCEEKEDHHKIEILNE